MRDAMEFHVEGLKLDGYAAMAIRFGRSLPEENVIQHVEPAEEAVDDEPQYRVVRTPREDRRDDGPEADAAPGGV